MSHIVVKVYMLLCDADGCEESPGDYVPRHGELEPLRRARRAAKDEGWTVRAGRDYCPKHS